GGRLPNRCPHGIFIFDYSQYELISFSIFLVTSIRPRMKLGLSSLMCIRPTKCILLILNTRPIFVSWALKTKERGCCQLIYTMETYRSIITLSRMPSVQLRWDEKTISSREVMRQHKDRQ